MTGVTGVSGLANLLTGIFAAQGLITGFSSVNKFGRAPNGVQTTPTDIWDRADATPTQQIWIAPTQARTHQLVSTSAADTGAGVGARTVRIFGLTSWDTSEISEELTMNGLVNVPTVNQYVIVHRVEISTKGATSTNVGTITATADVDGTITAAVRPSLGQTQMVVYGIPSTHNAYIGLMYGTILRTGGAAVAVDMGLLVNPEPQTELLNFLVKETFSIAKDGTSAYTRPFYVPLEVEGPAIIKFQGTSTVSDTDVFGGFDLILDVKR